MIKVLFFASLRDQLKVSELQLESVKNPDVNGLIDNLIAQGPLWDKAFTNKSIMVAVNQTMSKKSCVLNAGDEIAFFPPVTGG